MRVKEAIEQLQFLAHADEEIHPVVMPEQREAIEMAINSLEKWKTLQKRLEQYHEDCDLGVDEVRCLECNRIFFKCLQTMVKECLEGR